MSEEKKNDTSLLDPIEEVIAAVGRGELVIIVDDEDRENEGDFICAAEKVTPELINTMAVKGRGLICVTLEKQRALDVGLAPAPQVNQPNHALCTAFTESVDAAEGITTGISAADRSHTARLLASKDATISDFVRPGHIFPLTANEHGVLGRPGHTEASVDLARLAGLDASGVICEILSEDGSMARFTDLKDLAVEMGIKMGSLEQLIAYRQHSDPLIKFEQEINLPTPYGDFRLRSYTHVLNDECHLALIYGDVEKMESPLVRIHSECLTGDVFGSKRCDCGDQLDEAMKMVSEAGEGVILYMRQEGRGIGLAPKLHAYALQEKGYDTVEANKMLGFKADLRNYAISAQMLKDLKLASIRLITNNPEKVSGVEEYGITVSERIDSIAASNEHNKKYLATKKEKMGHYL